jgi:hypothetical protein
LEEETSGGGGGGVADVETQEGLLWSSIAIAFTGHCTERGAFVTSLLIVYFWRVIRRNLPNGLGFVYFSSLRGSWHLLNETIDELLRVNPQCLAVSSMERRVADGIDQFLDEMRQMDHIGGVEITPALQHTNGTTGDGGICEARRDCEHQRSGGDKCEYDRDENRRNNIQPPFSPRP